MELAPSRRRRLAQLVLLAVAAALLAAGCGDFGSTSGSDEAASDGSAEATPAGTVETVEVADVAPGVAAGDVLLVDVREQAEWDAGRARGAVHVPLAEVGAEVDDIELQASGRTLAVICRSGNRSAEAAAMLADAGLDVLNVDGGMQAWVDAGEPIEPADGTII